MLISVFIGKYSTKEIGVTASNIISFYSVNAKIYGKTGSFLKFEPKFYVETTEGAFEVLKYTFEILKQEFRGHYIVSRSELIETKSKVYKAINWTYKMVNNQKQSA